MSHLLRRFEDFWGQLRREAGIPAPPFRASKKTGRIMYGVWYGRLSPERARSRAAAWGLSPEVVERMISEATQPPSYWGRQPRGGEART
jgi:hypothetical protein